MRRLVFAAASAALGLCAASAVAGSYGLPWQPGTTMQLTQDCNDSCCADHVGNDKYAWDFANGTEFPIVAAREGTVAHVKVSSMQGCGNASCANDANYIVIDHGDDTASIYLHLKGGSLDPAVRCGEFVRRGQVLATADSTGWSTGTHLHFQVNGVRADMATTCECGNDGTGCAANAVAWNNFWTNATYPTTAIDFDEWGASQCGDRRIQLPASTNADQKEPVFTVDDGDAAHFSWVMGMGSAQADPSYKGAFASAPTQPSGMPTVIGKFSLAGVVTTPGIYEVWGFVPLSSHATSENAKHEVIARGARATGTVNQNSIGGGFHLVSGLPKLKFAGAKGEAILVRNDTGDVNEEIAFDGVLVHYIGAAGSAKKGDPCMDATECEGSLVCAGGACAEGCDVTGCSCGGMCDDTGLCMGGGMGGCGQGGGAATGPGATTGMGGGATSGPGATTGTGAGTGGGVADDGGVSSGCGCRIDASGSMSGAIAAAIAALALSFRRRRRSS